MYYCEHKEKRKRLKTLPYFILKPNLLEEKNTVEKKFNKTFRFEEMFMMKGIFNKDFIDLYSSLLVTETIVFFLLYTYHKSPHFFPSNSSPCGEL